MVSALGPETSARQKRCSQRFFLLRVCVSTVVSYVWMHKPTVCSVHSLGAILCFLLIPKQELTIFSHLWPGDSCVGRPVVPCSCIPSNSGLDSRYTLFLQEVLGTREIHVVWEGCSDSPQQQWFLLSMLDRYFLGGFFLHWLMNTNQNSGSQSVLLGCTIIRELLSRTAVSRLFW